MAEGELVYAYVGCYLCVSAPYWQTIDLYECDECPWEEIVKMPKEEWNEAGWPQFGLGFRCLKCEQYLEDPCHYELLENPSEEQKAQAMSWDAFGKKQFEIHQKHK